jgi:putative DNA-binding protein
MSTPQTQFRSALLDPARPVPNGLSDANHRPAGRRFDVYRNNVAVSLTEAMHSAFPVITKLLGAKNMDGLSGIYLRAHPPETPLMMFYGAGFPDFLAGMQQLSHLGYLPDIARLELALRASYHAADATPLPPDQLGALPPDRVMQARFTLAPSLRLLRSDWPIYDIWRFNTQDNAPKPQAKPQDVVILRPEFDPLPHLLTTGGADFIAALINQKTLGDAHEAALSTAPDFDLGPTLALLLQNGALTHLNMKG